MKGVRFTCWKAGNEIQIQKNLLLFIRGFSVWSAESRQRSFKDSSKERWYNTGHRNKARRKQQFSHFAPHPAHNRQYLESFPRPRCSLCITELQSILSGKGATSFAVPAQQCCINYHFSSPPRYCISLCVTLWVHWIHSTVFPKQRIPSNQIYFLSSPQQCTDGYEWDPVRQRCKGTVNNFQRQTCHWYSLSILIAHPCFGHRGVHACLVVFFVLMAVAEGSTVKSMICVVANHRYWWMWNSPRCM